MCWKSLDEDTIRFVAAILKNHVMLLFFFQAEDGIRDWSVTGVQTCALPILFPRDYPIPRKHRRALNDRRRAYSIHPNFRSERNREFANQVVYRRLAYVVGLAEIGRASCRERV